MRHQGLSALIFFLLVSAPAKGECFNWKEPALISALPLAQGARAEWTEFDGFRQTLGTLENGTVWAGVQSDINVPFLRVRTILENPFTIKGHGFQKLEVTGLPSKTFDKHWRIDLEISPVFFLKLHWAELWGFRLSQVQAGKKKRLELVYEKTEGTAHIQRFCGNVVVDELTPKRTRVFLYEELRAPRRSVEDLRNGLMGTLVTLQQSNKERTP
jgi:hypothetical protein